MNNTKLDQNQLENLIQELKDLNISPANFPGNTEHELIRYKQGKKFLLVYKTGSIQWKEWSELDDILKSNLLSSSIKGLEKLPNEELLSSLAFMNKMIFLSSVLVS